jgi:hypothetical protein
MCFQRILGPLIDPCQKAIGRLVLDRQGGCSVSSVSQQRSCDALERRGAGGERAAAREATPCPPRSPGSVWGTPKNFPVFFLKGVNDVV